MKKFITKAMGIILLIAGIFAVSMNVKASVQDDIKTEIEGRLTNGNIVKKVYCYDYDNNGTQEAFVLTGKEGADSEEDSQNLWFAYKKDGKVNASIIKKDVLMTSKVLKLKNERLFCAAEYCATSSPVDIYKVSGNQAKYIFQGDSVTKDKKNGYSFISIHSTYDAAYDLATGIYMGHTWKPYWFYYKNGKVYQYKAKKISNKAFTKRYKNAKKVLKKYKKYGKVISILRRDNGLVHINYEKSGQYMNVTFKIKGKKLVKPVVYDGKYLKKMPKIKYGSN